MGKKKRERALMAKKWWPVITAGVLIFVTGLIVLLSTGGSSFTVHGQQQVWNTSDGTSAAYAYPDVTNGTQVVVTDPSNHVIDTGSLTTDPSNTGQWYDLYDFTVKVPPESRYGIEIGNHGTVWFTESQMKNGPGLSLGQESN
jgi:hypothetical protein